MPIKMRLIAFNKYLGYYIISFSLLINVIIHVYIPLASNEELPVNKDIKASPL